ncbi:hypothetical protein TNCV_3773031 [Trichonephila clavipes]|nr:hypothetical protein TNCV_3773031 [Trichonephila clavipes]
MDVCVVILLIFVMCNSRLLLYEPRSGRPSDVNDEVLRSMMTNPTLTCTKGGFKFGIHQSTPLDYIKILGFVNKLFVRIPHETNEKNLMDRILICSSNLTCRKRGSVSDLLVTGDIKWIVYMHVEIAGRSEATFRFIHDTIYLECTESQLMFIINNNVPKTNENGYKRTPVLKIDYTLGAVSCEGLCITGACMKVFERIFAQIDSPTPNAPQSLKYLLRSGLGEDEKGLSCATQLTR